MLGPEWGPGEDMSKQPSSACLTSTTRGDLETTAHASRHSTVGGALSKPDGLAISAFLATLTGPSRLPLRAACGRP